MAWKLPQEILACPRRADHRPQPHRSAIWVTARRIAFPPRANLRPTCKLVYTQISFNIIRLWAGMDRIPCDHHSGGCRRARETNTPGHWNATLWTRGSMSNWRHLPLTYHRPSKCTIPLSFCLYSMVIQT